MSAENPRPAASVSRPRALDRRAWLRRSSMGFGAAALAGTLHRTSLAGPAEAASAGPAADGQPRPLPARADHVIFCFMSGGVSHVDSFDPKPELERLHGKPMPVKVERTQFNRNGQVMASPFAFQPGGKSGVPISDLFPFIREQADELAIIRSMTTPVNEHAQANYFLHSGFPTMGYPSAGAWCAYGLGAANESLPSYVVLQSGGATAPLGGVGIFSNGFLPAQHQASILKADGDQPLQNILPAGRAVDQRARLELAQRMNAEFLAATEEERQVEAAIRNYETAFRMQTAVPELCDFSQESAATQQMYAIKDADTAKAAYGRQCLLARRLVERGVRFVELSCLTRGIGAGNAGNPWDQHGDLEKGHRAMAQQVDQPISALLRDLRQRGLLDRTLVVFAGEFGRTPFSQGSNGRDHNPHGFSLWLAGGGVRGGMVYGATDPLGYHATEDRCEIYDLWATVLYQLGFDHKQLTYRYGGRDMRLTDVHGNVLKKILT